MIPVRVYVHLTSFQLQDLKPNFKKSQYQAYITRSTDRSGPAVKASILQDPSAVMARKRSTALPPLDVSQPAS